MTRSRAPIPKTNYIDLTFGKFDQTNPHELTSAFDTFLKSLLKRADPYLTPDVIKVTGAIPVDARVWSPTDSKAVPGFCVHAYKHGGFAKECKTKESVECFLVKP
jgi:hypothetical protein